MSDKLMDEARECANSVFGIRFLKPYQTLVISRIIQQDRMDMHVRDQIVILPTGMGKSMCFLVPALMCRGITVIVFPLLALMNDQLGKLEKAGVPCVCLRGGQSAAERREAFAQLEEKKAKIVVTTPETLSNPAVIGRLSRQRTSLFVIDEAHFIAQWGKEFRPAYAALGKAAQKLKPVQTLAFTATAGKDTLETIRHSLFSRPPLVVMADADRENIRYGAYPYLEKTQAVTELLQKSPRPALVFCRSRADTQRLCTECMRLLRGIPMRYYHAGLSNEERVRLERWFKKSDGGVMFATSAYGTGVDKGNVRTVIHHSLPSNAEEYLQESGRCGRDGNQAWAWVLVPVARQEKTTALEDVFTGNTCRRSALLGFLGQHKDECTGCDVCEKKTIDKTETLNLVLKMVRDKPFKLTPKSAAMVLTGQDPNDCTRYWNRLPHWDTDLLEKAILELASKGLIGRLEKKGVGYLLYPAGNRVAQLAAKALKALECLHGLLRT